MLALTTDTAGRPLTTDTAGRHMVDIQARVIYDNGGRTCQIAGAVVLQVARHGLELVLQEAVKAATHAWVEINLPGVGNIRPLVQFGRTRDGKTPVRFRHLLPADRAVLDSFFGGFVQA
jgi:hypothetical protein